MIGRDKYNGTAAPIIPFYMSRRVRWSETLVEWRVERRHETCAAMKERTG